MTIHITQHPTLIAANLLLNMIQMYLSLEDHNADLLLTTYKNLDTNGGVVCGYILRNHKNQRFTILTGLQNRECPSMATPLVKLGTAQSSFDKSWFEIDISDKPEKDDLRSQAILVINHLLELQQPVIDFNDITNP